MVGFLNIILRIAIITILIVLIVKQVKNIIFDILERKKSEEVNGEDDRCSDSPSNH